MRSISHGKMCQPVSAFLVCSGVILSGSSVLGCAADLAENDEVAFASTEQAIDAVVGDPLPGIFAEDFANAKAAFEVIDTPDDGLGPIFNERGCAVCHSLGATGGAGIQVERRFGKFNADGTFNTLSEKGGSLRQLFSIGAFTGLNGQACNVPLEVEPPEATAHAGRLTTPLFGAGLIDAIPDSVIAANASAQPAAVRGVVNRVPVLLPNPGDSTPINGTRVGRFGWKAAIANLTQFSADAYLNEQGVTTQHCVRGLSVLTFASELKPNGVAVPPGCDDLVVQDIPIAGVPAETDDVVGSCAGGLSEIQEDVGLFTLFMTFVAPAPRLPIDPATNRQGGAVFSRIGCAQCHLLKDYVTPAQPSNGVPGNFTFRPRSDFLLHDIGTGDGIGNDGDSRARTNLLRTAPLWGLHLRPRLLHDGSVTTIEQAIAVHGKQAAASRSAFNALSASDRNAMLAAMKSD